jgi:2,3-bisphosphoglycerate-independent phosphoglycerate mutase
MAGNFGLKNIFIHAFTDGRDTDPQSGLEFVDDLEKKISTGPAKIASVVGRYYAMDRDKRWERIKLAYDLLVHGKGELAVNAHAGIEASYRNGVTDEFIKPVCIVRDGKPVGTIKDGDAVISFNFRTDRCREITHVLSQEDMPDYGMKKLNLHYVTMTNYDKRFKNVHVVYEKDNLVNTLGEVISKAGKKQIRISETEKYPHVTFFFSGGREQAFEGEERILINSPKVATYDLKPSMSAFEVTEALLKELRKGETDFVCLNYANADMVGHTGVFTAAVEAVETVDKCVSDVVTTGLEKGYSFIITADHGNADFMVNADGSPNTAHTTNPVPCFLVSPSNRGIAINDGTLADLAPTILNLMGIPIPSEMTGKSLLTEKK